MSLAKNWCFTLNNPTDDEFMALLALETNTNVNYLVFQKEQGENETPHLQGYVQLAGKKRMAGVKQLIGNRAHVELARGTAQENRNYCTKEDTRVGNIHEFGTMIGKGQRNDVKALVEASKEHSIDENFLMDNFPEILARFPRFCASLRKRQQENNVPQPLYVPRTEWQTALVSYLSREPDPREIRWYYDPVGNNGKSYFSTRYQDGRNGRPYVITGGKHSDMLYSFDYERVVIFDLPRTVEDHVPYAVMEAFKNGYFFSTKYEPRRCRFNVPHVIVFANFMPDQSKLSLDRWSIKQI